ncbi:Meiosis specific protein SPO22 [Cordyceps fumosorosea ARSEF 2679]|uniref:Meiosis specific protein SPO22 n=1 Tax=Cordyceps fumosorosea (strain ARSEF 2679) TaxID=1081104 RepID=A0A167LB11_CORFA|nr:Meiosis specific protein SPO22 [Cordyceps fumosorosea ARSEF 2679]OAA52867.1 Meiosis specific protein SPO22 [Cordyceps fumosorosea ARSEF 2679]
MDSKAPFKQSPPPSVVANKPAATLLHFATDLESSVRNGGEVNHSDLEYYTLRANDPSQFPVGTLAQDTAHQLESIGRRIWNTFLRKQGGVFDEERSRSELRFCLRARLFGYLLLGIGLVQRPEANAAQSTAYLIRLGLALSKVCIKHSDLGSARIALQKITEYLSCRSGCISPAGGDNAVIRQSDHACYYILRIALSWKDDRLDLAEHMYAKATQHTPYIDTGTRMTLVHVLTQIGESIVAKSNPLDAAPWFRRAAAESRAYSDNNRDTLGTEADMRTHQQTQLKAHWGLVQCLAGLKSREPLQEALSVVQAAQAEFGERRIEVLEMLVAVQTAQGNATDALTDLLEGLLS